ncbi:competence type IV pilus minor pilin ComGE [Bacillus timonensis]|uniref:competence type IV pilus minor pilin ComGE n=1 Tax=Bacillus timonensis TaxID=1033734 RepID=UPI00028934AF|nr:competence type IV pilus minor pilin ComGE [Bacillus timonensis]
MLVKDKRGFTMVEMLLSVSIWLMLCATLLPQFMFIMTERRNIDLRNMGNQLLTEELQKEFNGEASNLGSTVKNGVTYQFSKTYNEGLQGWQLCVSWQDKLTKTYERCGYINGE